jgi:hypothetical protein
VKSWEFDTTDLPGSVEGIYRILGDVRGATVSIEMAGPGGGWPAVTVACPEGPSAEAFEAWLVEGQMSWCDQDGEIHDHA